MTANFFNFIGKLNNKKSGIYCKFVNDSIIFDSDNSIKLCPLSDFGVIKKNFNGIWLNTDEISSVKTSCIKEMQNHINEPPCNDCIYQKADMQEENNHAFKYLYLSQWKNCYLNCSYCTKPKQEDLIAAKHYDILPSIQSLIDNKLIDRKTKVIFDCGDACIHPEFDKILFFFINYEMEDIKVHTPAMRYCESVSEMIAKNIGEVIVSFDSGCPYIYEKIKGINKFDIAIYNIKRYLSYQEPGQKRVILKYLILKGINDNKKEILDWFMLARDLGVKKLAVDIDNNFFDEIRYNIPYYLKDLLVFTRNISAYNDLEIEFYDKVNILYDSFNKEEIKD